METNEYGFDIPSGNGINEAYLPNSGVNEAQARGVLTQEHDDFWGGAFEEEALTAALRVDLPPEGDYAGQGLSVEERENIFTHEKELSCYGWVVNAEGTRTRVRFDLQPRKGFNSLTGKVAWNHILFKQALKGFVKAVGVVPKSPDEFVDFLERSTFKYRLVPNQKATGMRVMQIDLLETAAVETGNVPVNIGPGDDDIPF